MLFQLAQELYVSGAYGDAVARLHEALSLASELSLKRTKLEMFCFLGECLVSMGEYDKAFEQIDAGLKAFGLNSTDPAVATGCLIKADAAMSQNLLNKADKMLKQASQILKAGREHGHLQARLYKGKGWSYMLRGDFTKARRAFLLAILWYRKTEERFHLARVLVDYFTAAAQRAASSRFSFCESGPENISVPRRQRRGAAIASLVECSPRFESGSEAVGGIHTQCVNGAFGSPIAHFVIAVLFEGVSRFQKMTLPTDVKVHGLLGPRHRVLKKPRHAQSADVGVVVDHVG